MMRINDRIGITRGAPQRPVRLCTVRCVTSNYITTEDRKILLLKIFMRLPELYSLWQIRIRNTTTTTTNNNNNNSNKGVQATFAAMESNFYCRFISVAYTTAVTALVLITQEKSIWYRGFEEQNYSHGLGCRFTILTYCLSPHDVPFVGFWCWQNEANRKAGTCKKYWCVLLF